MSIYIPRRFAARARFGQYLMAKADRLYIDGQNKGRLLTLEELSELQAERDRLRSEGAFQLSVAAQHLGMMRREQVQLEREQKLQLAIAAEKAARLKAV